MGGEAMARPNTLTGNALADINGAIKPGWRAVQDWARFGAARLQRCRDYDLPDIVDALADDADWLLQCGYEAKFGEDPDFARTTLHDIATGTLPCSDLVAALGELQELAAPSREGVA
jgi:hypothetical protein